MKKSTIIFLTIVVLAIIILGGVVFNYFENNKPESTFNAELLSTYPMLANGDRNFTEARRNAEFIFVKDQTLIIENKTIKTDVVDNKATGKFICNNQVRIPMVYISRNNGAVGGWASTSVIDCDTYYWIYYSGDSGPEIYGPFSK